MKLVVEDPRRWVLPELLRQRAREQGDRRFLSFAVDEAAVTYGEADELSDRLAAGLAALGVARGDRALVAGVGVAAGDVRHPHRYYSQP